MSLTFGGFMLGLFVGLYSSLLVYLAWAAICEIRKAKWEWLQ